MLVPCAQPCSSKHQKDLGQKRSAKTASVRVTAGVCLGIEAAGISRPGHGQGPAMLGISNREIAGQLMAVGWENAIIKIIPEGKEPEPAGLLVCPRLQS